MIFDTDVLIWFMRGNEKAIEAVVNEIPFSISAVTYMELIKGVRNKQELTQIKKSFKKMGVQVIPINESVSNIAISFVEKYTLGHSVELADALIAGTCIENDEVLFTANDKHYKAITGLKLQVFRP